MFFFFKTKEYLQQAERVKDVVNTESSEPEAEGGPEILLQVSASSSITAPLSTPREFSLTSPAEKQTVLVERQGKWGPRATREMRKANNGVDILGNKLSHGQFPGQGRIVTQSQTEKIPGEDATQAPPRGQRLITSGGQAHDFPLASVRSVGWRSPQGGDV